MGVLDLEGLNRSLATDGAAPFYLLLGASTWHRNQALEAIRQATVPEEDRALAETRGRVRECDLTEILDSARTLPLGVDRRLVILTGGSALDREETELLVEYASAPRRTTTVVLCATKLPAGPGARALKLAACTIECAEPRSWEVVGWIRSELGRRGLEHHPGVPEALQALLGNSPQEIAAGLDKLELYVQGHRSQALRIDDVDAVLSRVPHGTVWQFIEALEDRDSERALRCLAASLEVGEPAESVLRLMLRSRRQLMAGLAARERGAGDDAVLEAMGTSPRARRAPRVRKSILARLGRHRLEEVVEALPLLLEADSRIKGGGAGDPEVILARLVIDLVSSLSGRALHPSVRS